MKIGWLQSRLSPNIDRLIEAHNIFLMEMETHIKNWRVKIKTDFKYSNDFSYFQVFRRVSPKTWIGLTGKKFFSQNMQNRNLWNSSFVFLKIYHFDVLKIPLL